MGAGRDAAMGEETLAKETLVDEEAPQEDVVLSWRNVTFSVGDGAKVILDGVWGEAVSGRLVGLMGPSGSGKTTLLDTLAQRVDGTKKGRSLKGAVTVNGMTVAEARKRDGLRMAYVQQEDALVGVLTVRETLEVAAALAGEPKERSEELIREFGLESAADTLVGTIFQKGISGGQKRRVSIAVELMSFPRLVLLDEPTSGLDSASALAVTHQLKQIATASETSTKSDRMVIAFTLHQPSSAIWAEIDDVCFLAKGRMCYFGPNREPLLGFLDECGHPVPQFSNIADFVLELINEDFPGHADVDEICASFAKKTPPPDEDNVHTHTITVAVHETRAPWLSRFFTLCGRGTKELLRDFGIVGVRLAMYSMLSVLVALMFLNLGEQHKDQDVNARVSVLFYVAAFMVFMSVAVLPFFVLYRPIFVKERCNGAYGVSEYVLSKFITSVPGVLVIALACTVIIVPATGLNGFFIYFLDLFISLMVAESFMALMAACVPHFIIGIALAAGLFGFNMLCEGFFRVKSDIPDYLIWGYYQAFHTYTFRIFMHNEFKPINRFDGPFFTDGEDVLRFYDMHKISLLNDFLVLFAWLVFFQIAFALVLYYYHTGRR